MFLHVCTSACDFSIQSSSRLITLPHKFTNEIFLNALRFYLWITNALTSASTHELTTEFTTQITINTCLTNLPLKFTMRITIAFEIETPDWFMPAIKNTLATAMPLPSKSPIQFEWSPSAMRMDSELLESVNCRTGDLITKCPSSEIGCGSEFRPVHILEPLLKCRKNWDCTKSFLQSGFAESSWFLKIC